MKYEINDPVRLTDDGRAILAIDQTLLPNHAAYIRIETQRQMYNAIRNMQVRGAPCIGIFAAYAMFLQAKRMERTAANNMRRSFDTIVEAMRKEAEDIHEGNIRTCFAIANYGLSLVNEGEGILTLCNAGALATSRYGTALGPLLLGAEKGMDLKAFVCETRPRLQGARLTAYELINAGIDTTLICDSMASVVMKEKKVKACFVGCDRVAKNGDTVNEIGTSSLAILARFYKVPFYVFCPTSSIDVSCDNGSKIEIDRRDPDEIKTEFFKSPVAPEAVKCYNPAADVTDARLITAIITEEGINYPPYDFV